MRLRHLLTLLFFVCFAVSAHAIDRAFPKGNQVGKVSLENYPVIMLDGEPCVTSAALRIWNAKNMTQVPASLAGAKFLARYTVDNMHQVNRIWILREREIPQAEVDYDATH